MIIQDPYLHYSLEDFFWDERFRTDVMNGGKDFAYWEQWVKQYPDKEPIIEKAKLLILSVYIDNAIFHEDEVQELVRDTQRILELDNIDFFFSNILRISIPTYLHKKQYYKGKK